MGKYLDAWKAQQREAAGTAEPERKPLLSEKLQKRLRVRMLENRWKAEKGREFDQGERSMVENDGIGAGPEDLRQHRELLEWLGVNGADIDSALEASGSYRLEKSAPGATEVPGVVRTLAGMAGDKYKAMGKAAAAPFKALAKGEIGEAYGASVNLGRDLAKQFLPADEKILSVGKEAVIGGALDLSPKTAAKAAYEQAVRGGDKQQERLRETLIANKASGANALISEHANSSRFIPDYSTVLGAAADPMNLPGGAIAGKIGKAVGLAGKESSLAGKAAGIADDAAKGKPLFSPKPRNEIKSLLGSREEMFQTELGDKVRGSKAYFSEATEEAREQAIVRDVVEKTNLKLANESTLELLRKIPWFGKQEGFVAKASEIARKLPFGIGKKAGITADRQAALFDAAEGIRDIDPATGKIQFGTRIWGTDAAGNKVVTGWRKKPVEAVKNWLALSSKEKDVVRWWTGEAKAIKAAEGVTSDVEGYVRHYFQQDDGFFGGFKKALNKITPGSWKKRGEAEGYIRNFEKAVKERLKEGGVAVQRNKWLPEFLHKITEPVPPGGAVPSGWRVVDKTQAGRFGKFIPEMGGGRMMPNVLWDEFKRYREATSEVSKIGDALRAVGTTMKGSMLLSPGTTMRNIRGGATLLATGIVNDLMEGIATGNFKALRSSMTGWMRGLHPEMINELPKELWGGGAAGVGSEFAKKGVVGKVIGWGLKPFEMVENYFKRVHAITAIERMGFKIEDKAKILSEDALMESIIKRADEFGLDYRNLSRANRKFSENPLAAFIVPFTKYPEKLWRFYGRYLVEPLSPTSGLSARDRAVRLMTAGAMMASAEGLARMRGTSVTHALPNSSFEIDPTGRIPASGVGEDGKQSFMRTRDNPWMDLREIAGKTIGAAKGDEPAEPLMEFAKDYIGSGPLWNGAMFMLGYRTKYDYGKPSGAIIGRIVKPLIPGSTVVEGFKKTLGGEKKRTKTFWDELSAGLPVPTSGEPRRDNRTGEIVMFNQPIENLKFWMGVNLLEIDTAEWDAKKAKDWGRALKDFNSAPKGSTKLAAAAMKLQQIDPEAYKQLMDGIDDDGNVRISPDKEEIMRKAFGR